MKDNIYRRITRILRSVADSSTPRFLAIFVKLNKANALDMTHMPQDGIPNLVPDEFVGDLTKISDIIFQTWKSKSMIPENYRYWRDTFISKNPESMVILWDDEDNRIFIGKNFPWFIDTYDSYPKEIFRADAVRFFFLFLFGGLYVDMDSECLKPLELGRKADHVLLARMGTIEAFEHSIPNAIMASRPRQIFWLLAISRMMALAEHNPDAEIMNRMGPERLTGPILLKQTYDEFLALDEAGARERTAEVMSLLTDEQRESVRYGPVTLLGRRHWYPIDWTNAVHKRFRDHIQKIKYVLSPDEAAKLFPDSEMVTYWTHSW